MPIAQYVGVLIEKSIRRRNYATVYAHEIPILHRMHDCPVHVLRITDEGRNLNVPDEWERLSQKFGEHNERPFIEQIYRNPGELARAMEQRLTEADLSPLARSLETEIVIEDSPVLSPKVKLGAAEMEQEPAQKAPQGKGKPEVPPPMDMEMLRDVLGDWDVHVRGNWGEARMREEVRKAAIQRLGEFGIEELDNDLSAEQLVELAETMQERADALEA